MIPKKTFDVLTPAGRLSVIDPEQANELGFALAQDGKYVALPIGIFDAKELAEWLLAWCKEHGAT